MQYRRQAEPGLLQQLNWVVFANARLKVGCTWVHSVRPGAWAGSSRLTHGRSHGGNDAFVGRCITGTALLLAVLGGTDKLLTVRM